MRTLSIALLAAACIFLGARDGAAGATLKDGELSYTANGKTETFTSDEVAAQNVRGSEMNFVTLDEEAAARIGKKPTLLIFDASGQLAAETSSIPNVEIEQISALFLSPGGKTLAVDSGTWVVRAWDFVSYPALASKGRGIGYLSPDEGMADMLWVDDDHILTTTIDEKSGRPCGDYDPCGKRSVVLYQVSSGKTTPVLAGTDLCDYNLASFADNQVTAEKACGKKVADWKTDTSIQKNVKRERISVPLPGKK